MTNTKAVATPPGEPTLKASLTAEDQSRFEAIQADAEAEKVPTILARVKQSAGGRILDIAPEWKQRNMIARAVQLVEINGNRTPAEQAELDQYQAIWDKVQAIRLYSDSLEGQVNAAEDPLSVDIENGWPT